MNLYIVDMLAGMPKVWANASPSVSDLQARQAELVSAAQTIQATADAESRNRTEDEEKKITALMDEFDELQADIELRERMNAQAAMLQESGGRLAPPAEPGAASDAGAAAEVSTGGQPQAAKQRESSGRRGAYASAKRVEEGGPSQYGQHGFHNFGEYALAVQRASLRSGAYTDPRLVVNAPTPTSSSGVPADGGYAIPPDFRNEIMRKVMGEASIVGYTDQQTSSSNSITFPTDETTPWQSTGGVQVYWTGEGSKITESKVALGESNVKLEKIAALLPVTEELLADAPALSRYITSKVPQKMGFALNDAIINGDGTGKPMGIMNSGALLTAAAEASQTADTITYRNIVSMWARLHSAGKSKSVWLVNPMVDEQLMMMSFPGSGTAVPVYMPPAGAADTPYARLFGRPVIPTEACAAVGDVGDILLADLSQYMSATKTQGMRADVSMHLYFDYDIMAFRFILRFGGKPWWSAPIDGKAAGVKYSAFVALAERAGI